MDPTLLMKQLSAKSLGSDPQVDRHGSPVVTGANGKGVSFSRAPKPSPPGPDPTPRPQSSTRTAQPLLEVIASTPPTLRALPSMTMAELSGSIASPPPPPLFPAHPSPNPSQGPSPTPPNLTSTPRVVRHEQNPTRRPQRPISVSSAVSVPVPALKWPLEMDGFDEQQVEATSKWVAEPPATNTPRLQPGAPGASGLVISVEDHQRLVQDRVAILTRVFQTKLAQQYKELAARSRREQNAAAEGAVFSAFLQSREAERAIQRATDARLAAISAETSRKLTAANDNAESAAAQLAQALEQVASLESQLVSVNNDKDGLKNDLVEADELNEDLRAQLKESGETVSLLQSTISRLQSQLADSQAAAATAVASAPASGAVAVMPYPENLSHANMSSVGMQSAGGRSSTPDTGSPPSKSVRSVSASVGRRSGSPMASSPPPPPSPTPSSHTRGRSTSVSVPVDTRSVSSRPRSATVGSGTSVGRPSHSKRPSSTPPIREEPRTIPRSMSTNPPRSSPRPRAATVGSTSSLRSVARAVTGASMLSRSRSSAVPRASPRESSVRDGLKKDTTLTREVLIERVYTAEVSLMTLKDQISQVKESEAAAKKELGWLRKEVKAGRKAVAANKHLEKEIGSLRQMIELQEGRMVDMKASQNRLGKALAEATSVGLLPQMSTKSISGVLASSKSVGKLPPNGGMPVVEPEVSQVRSAAETKALEDMVAKMETAVQSVTGELDSVLGTALTCPACLDPMTEPATLVPCGHTVCGTCVSASERTLGRVTCEECGEDAGSVTAVPNSALDSILSRLSAHAQASNKASNMLSLWQTIRENLLAPLSGSKPNGSSSNLSDNSLS